MKLQFKNLIGEHLRIKQEATITNFAHHCVETDVCFKISRSVASLMGMRVVFSSRYPLTAP